MLKKIVWEWETIESNPASVTQRAKVIGGWLVNHYMLTTGPKRDITQTSESMCFVADRDHEWHIVPPFKEERPPESKLAADFGAPDTSKAKA